MPKTHQSTPKAHTPVSKQSSFGGHLLTIGAVTVLAGALAIKAALPALQGTAEHKAVALTPIKATVQVAKAEDANHTVRIATSIQLPDFLANDRASLDAVDKARITPATAQLLPTQDQKNVAKVALAQRLASLNLRYALLASRPAKNEDVYGPSAPAGSNTLTAEATAPAGLAADTAEPETVVAGLAEPADITADPSTVDALPMIDAETATVQVASLSPSNVLPVPAMRPKPLVRTKPGAISKPSSAPNTRQTTQAPVLAYAKPQEPGAEDSPFSGLGKLFNGKGGGLPGRSSKIAVYDISAAVVHMPDGSKLKANSGIGHRMNKPKYAYVKNLGPTPPNVYKLRMRERRFHGVEAIRMLPYDVAAMRGRDGMLAHSPLLRRSKGSHGCVAFTHYDKFLRAFKQGKVKTMIVVPDMSKLPKYMALYNERKYASR